MPAHGPSAIVQIAALIERAIVSPAFEVAIAAMIVATTSSTPRYSTAVWPRSSRMMAGPYERAGGVS